VRGAAHIPLAAPRHRHTFHPLVLAHRAQRRSSSNARAQTQSFATADGLKLDSQVAQLVSAMASFSSANPGFDPTTATQVPNDPALQGVVAAAWHA
jgi:hypothetical protein